MKEKVCLVVLIVFKCLFKILHLPDSEKNSETIKESMYDESSYRKLTLLIDFQE